MPPLPANVDTEDSGTAGLNGLYVKEGERRCASPCMRVAPSTHLPHLTRTTTTPSGTLSSASISPLIALAVQQLCNSTLAAHIHVGIADVESRDRNARGRWVYRVTSGSNTGAYRVGTECVIDRPDKWGWRVACLTPGGFQHNTKCA